MVVFKTIVFIKFVVLLTIVNDDPFLNEREETDLKGICTYYWVVFKKISRSFNSPTTVKLHVRRHSIKLHVFYFPKTTVMIKFVVLLTVVNKNPSLTIVNIIVNKKISKTTVFQKRSFFKNNRKKNGRKSFY